MMKTLNTPQAVLDLVARLAANLATELDLNHDALDPEIFADELALLKQAKDLLASEPMEVPDAVNHVLGR